MAGRRSPWGSGNKGDDKDGGDANAAENEEKSAGIHVLYLYNGCALAKVC